MQLREKTLDEAAFEKRRTGVIRTLSSLQRTAYHQDNVELAKKSMRTEFTSDSLIWR